MTEIFSWIKQYDRDSSIGYKYPRQDQIVHSTAPPAAAILLLYGPTVDYILPFLAGVVAFHFAQLNE